MLAFFASGRAGEVGCRGRGGGRGSGLIGRWGRNEPFPFVISSLIVF